MTTVNVTSCTNCPFLYQESEYPHSICKLADKNLWGMGYYRNGGPTPAECPLRKQPYTVKIAKNAR